MTVAIWGYPPMVARAGSITIGCPEPVIWIAPVTTPCEMMSALPNGRIGGPSSRMPCRLESGETRNSRSSSARHASGPNRLACGPRVIRIGPVWRSSGARWMRAHGAVDGPVARRSPRRNGRPSWPPNPPTRSVERLPSRSGTSIPPATQSQARAPWRGRPPNVSSSPGRTTRTASTASETPFNRAPRFAPETTMRPCRRNRMCGPLIVISRPVAPSGFPSSRLPRISAILSAAPPGATPIRP